MSPAAACLPVGRQMPPPGRTSSGLPDAGKRTSAPFMPKSLSVINAISVELMIARPSMLRLASIDELRPQASVPGQPQKCTDEPERHQKDDDNEVVRSGT